ncbi:MAG: TFIIB-type zinc ribbon-containing protein [Succinivibrionaceae bacterium]|nr:TFIIB-type zinc ribbon-containing protein [Succinivibrionaceae bacterium]
MSETDRYKCPSCSGTMEFSPKSQKLKCPFCDYELSLEEYQKMADDKAANNVDIQAGAKKMDDPESEEGAAAKYVCNTCGGEISPSFTSASTKCPFCDAPIVLTDKIKGQQVPDLMIPFAREKKDVKETYLKFVNGCHFVPADFKSSAHIDAIEATYVPFWLYSSKTDAELTVSGEVITRSSMGNVETIKHDVYSLYRHVTMDFEDVPADGSKDMDDALMDSLEPFKVKEAQPYNSAYLSGFGAQIYDVSAEDNYARVRTRMENSVKETVLKSLSRDYENLKVESDSYQYSNNSIKYALFPVWIQKTSWNGEEYVFAMNGQTGKFVGRVPVDMTKVVISISISTVLLTAIGGAIYHFLMNPEGSLGGDFGIAFIVCAVICGIVHAVLVSGNNNVAQQTAAVEYSGDMEPLDSSEAFVRSYTERRERK